MPDAVPACQSLIDHYLRLGGVLVEASGEGLELNRLQVGRQGDLLVCEEIFSQIQVHTARFLRPMPWLFVVQAGALALDVDHGLRDVFLKAEGDGPNACLTSSLTVELTVMQPGTTLSRLQLPETCRWKPYAPHRCVRVDLSLLVPMTQMVIAAALRPPVAAVAKSLTDNVYHYLSEQLGVAGIQLSHDLDPISLMIEHIQTAAEVDLSLADLARAARISARRLQELTKQKYNVTPMELLRRERLNLLHRSLRDPRQQGVPLATLMQRFHLSNNTKTRQLFKTEFGALPSELRRLSQYGDRVA